MTTACCVLRAIKNKSAIVINPPDGNVLFQQLVEEYASNGSLENVQETAQQVICEFQSRLVEKLTHGAIATTAAADRMMLFVWKNTLLRMLCNKPSTRTRGDRLERKCRPRDL